MSNSNLLIKIPAMTIGAAGAVLSAYSIVKDGNAKARCETKEHLGEAYLNMSVKNLSSSRESHLLEKVKHYVTKHRLDNSYYPYLVQTKNHVVHWIAEAAENIIPITLSAITIGLPILFKKPKNNTKINNPAIKISLRKKLSNLPHTEKVVTTISAISAGLLALGAGKFFIHDVWGKGKNKEY